MKLVREGERERTLAPAATGSDGGGDGGLGLTKAVALGDTNAIERASSPPSPPTRRRRRPKPPWLLACGPMQCRLGVVCTRTQQLLAQRKVLVAPLCTARVIVVGSTSLHASVS